MSGRLSGKTKEKFIRTFEKLVQFDKARINLIFDDAPEKTLTPQQREALLLGQRGDFNFHLWLVTTLSRIKARLNRDGWSGLKEHEQALVAKAARLAELDFPNFAKRSLAVSERYFKLENRSREGKTKDE